MGEMEYNLTQEIKRNQFNYCASLVNWGDFFELVVLASNAQWILLPIERVSTGA